MMTTRLFVATGEAVARVDLEDDALSVTLMLEGSGAQCVAVDPLQPERVYVGTFDNGLFCTSDGGVNWNATGMAIPHQRVLSVAMAPARATHGRSAVFAGTEPSNLYRSEDDGVSWEPFPALPLLPSAPGWSFPPRPWTSHVRWIAPDWHDPELLFVGIELGGVMRSTDGGLSWEDRKPNSQHDAHAVLTHPSAAGRVYEAAGGGVAFSRDAGASWHAGSAGLSQHYTWGLAVDPHDPDLWYVSAARSAREAHRGDGHAQAELYRQRGDGGWQPLSGGLPQPLPYMPYALLTLHDRPNTLLAGFQHGELWRSDDAGDSWRQLRGQLPALLALSEARV
jgi:hypothetical protein